MTYNGPHELSSNKQILPVQLSYFKPMDNNSLCNVLISTSFIKVFIIKYHFNISTANKIGSFQSYIIDFHNIFHYNVGILANG